MTCDNCGRKFSKRSTLRQHRIRRVCEDTPFLCHICGQTIRSLRKLQLHIKLHETTNQDNEGTAERDNNYLTNFQDEPETVPNLINMPEDTLEEVRINWRAIRSHYVRGPLTHFLNLRWENGQAPQWSHVLDSIHNSLRTSYKINFSNSYVLSHVTDGTTRYFHASYNNHRFYHRPRLIENRQNVENLIQDLDNFDHASYALKNRESTKWRLVGIVATSIYIYPIDFHPIGCATVGDLPRYISQNKGIYTLLGYKDTNYFDNLCLYRTIAMKQGASYETLEEKLRELTQDIDVNNFTGIKMKDLKTFEMKYSLTINVYEFDNKNDVLPPPLMIVRESTQKFKDTMNLLLYKGHFMYIHDMALASKSYKCKYCEKLFKFQSRMKYHTKVCKGARQIYQYTGGAYQPSDTILETLADLGYDVDEYYIYPFRSCWDFEVILDKNRASRSGSKTQIHNVHVPISCSVHSNVPGFDTVASFVNRESPQELINEVVQYLEDISSKSYQLLSNCYPFNDILNDLEEKIGLDDKIVNYDSIHARLVEYLQELPVVGFNSGKYDWNLIKPYISRKLYSEDSENVVKFISKDNNNFKVISTEKLKFLDVTKYLAPGVSYDKYLKAFGIAESKLVFPYEYLDSVEKLDDRELPPFEAFYSHLKKSNISRDQYEECKQIWDEHNMETLEDFLKFYNERDVFPFMQALEKQVDYYQQLGLDMLKDAIGIPGLTLRYLFKTLPEGVIFSLCGKKQSYLHDLYRKFLVGGPSLIFHRFHEVDKTFIRGGDVVVKTIEGWDANSLYLHCLSLDMPTDIPTIYRKEKMFAAQHADYFGKMALDWLEYVSFNDGIKLKHKFNGKEKRFGKVPVDGWDERNKTAYNFHGCLWHGHLDNCSITSKYVEQINPVNKKSFISLNENTQKVNKFLREKIGIRVIEIYQCQWDHLKTCNKQIKKFLKKRKKNTLRKKTLKGLSISEICDLVQKEKIFGVVQCDIQVPETERADFHELPPIFKNVNISRKDIGGHMLKIAEDRGLLNQPRRSMISSFFGKEILLTTPLLKYYLDKKLTVTDIQMVVQYRPSRCFKKFQEKVSNDRREGAGILRDAQSVENSVPNTCKASNSKLMGNSAYGKCISNKTRYTDVRYIDCKLEAQKIIAQWNFKNMTELESVDFDAISDTDDYLCEIETIKPRVVWDLPIQIGFFVYQYAKLCMLRFYFDCLCYYIDKSQFQLTEMDTDSFYLALGSKTLEQAVKPDKKIEFFKNYHLWFPRPACEAHYSQWVEMTLKDENFRAIRGQCCVNHENFEKYTPGLFKQEYKGEGIIALGSKTYLCFGGQKFGYSEDPKIRCKGLNAAQNKLTVDTFKNVLSTKQCEGGQNTNFKTSGGKMFTYSQHRDALNYFYIKRIVEDDGVTTSPLDL